jgi:hypothetical protein
VEGISTELADPAAPASGDAWPEALAPEPVAATFEEPGALEDPEGDVDVPGGVVVVAAGVFVVVGVGDVGAPGDVVVVGCVESKVPLRCH